MIHIDGQTFGAGAFIQMDDKYFSNCRFEDGCTVIFSGGDVEWVQCAFGNVKISFAGAAQRTMNFARMFNLVKAPTEQPNAQGIPGTSKGEH